MFKALVLEENEDRKVSSSIQDLDESSLPEGDVTVDIQYSTLNYKDGMVVSGIGRLVRTYPHVPGIDFAGTVSYSSHADYKPGDQVVLTGWRVGEMHWGGFSQKARVKGDWLVALPDGLSAKQAMGVGTAGIAGMLAIMALEDHGLSPDDGEVLVTGAAGGVGSIAVAMLAALGYNVAASTGREETHAYLKDLGATTIIDRAELSEQPGRPLDKERWAGCVDNVAGDTLAHVLSQMKYGSSVAAVGLAGGTDLNSTVLPFLLRGVNILGIDSVVCPRARREAAWQRLADHLDLAKLDAMINEAPLGDVPALAKNILKGQVRGRMVIDVNG